MRRKIAVIGAGYGGLRFFVDSLELAVLGGLAGGVEYIFFDERPRKEYGRGVAWASDQNHHMRANMHSPEIQIDPDAHETVGRILGIQYDHKPTANELFTQREKIGAMFEAQFNSAVQHANEAGIKFTSHEDRVVDVCAQGIGYQITTRAGTVEYADFVVIALGHIPPTNYKHLFHKPGYIRNPWHRAKPFSDINSDSRVGLLGLGPTAVDVIITLRDQGVKKIRGYSRTGAMQYPRPIPKKLEPRVFTEDNLLRVATLNGGLTLDLMLGMLAAEFLTQDVDWQPLLAAIKTSEDVPLNSLRIGYANCNKESNWFGLCTALTGCIPIIWHTIKDNEREKFLALQRKISNVLYGMAPSHALRMLAELEARSLEVFGGITHVEAVSEGARFHISRESGVEVIRDELDFVIDCTGFGTDITLSESDLIKSILKREIVTPHPFGGANVDFESGQVRSPTSGRQHRIFVTTGTLNIGTRLATNGLGEVAWSARRTANAIHKLL